ncbi:MAG: glycosyltransferase [Acidobacteria bacterium]|nr:glycosyltransferase [Acidobacteriota bacterium]
MKILYLGSDQGTSKHRADALLRLGHEVEILNPVKFVSGVPLAGAIHRYLGGIGLVSKVQTQVLQSVRGSAFDLVWVDNGALVSRPLVDKLRRVAPRIINYNLDDPFGTRDVNAWAQYRSAVSAYDLVVVVREENIAEAQALNAKQVLHVYRAADEVAHAPRELTTEEKSKWQSDVLFIGTAFPERGAFFRDLIRLGVPLSIFGGKWSELKEWPVLKHCWKGAGLEDAYSYSTAILAAKVSLGLLSKGNRDLHTQRSLEIPSLGGVFCAERTSEHLNLYREDEEAVFWSSPAECAEKCAALLKNDTWRRSVSVRGHERFVKNGWTNMNVAEMILRAAFE